MGDIDCEREPAFLKIFVGDYAYIQADFNEWLTFWEVQPRISKDIIVGRTPYLFVWFTGGEPKPHHEVRILDIVENPMLRQAKGGGDGTIPG